MSVIQNLTKLGCMHACITTAGQPQLGIVCQQALHAQGWQPHFFFLSSPAAFCSGAKCWKTSACLSKNASRLSALLACTRPTSKRMAEQLQLQAQAGAPVLSRCYSRIEPDLASRSVCVLLCPQLFQLLLFVLVLSPETLSLFASDLFSCSGRKCCL